MLLSVFDRELADSVAVGIRNHSAHFAVFNLKGYMADSIGNCPCVERRIASLICFGIQTEA